MKYSQVLHSYKITRFSNCFLNILHREHVLHSYKITRFSNYCTHLYLTLYSFTLLQNYKVLKRLLPFPNWIFVLHSYKITRFSNATVGADTNTTVLHSYKITRFSNFILCRTGRNIVLHSYKITRFSNCNLNFYVSVFCFTLLQNYKVLKLFYIHQLL